MNNHLKRSQRDGFQLIIIILVFSDLNVTEETRTIQRSVIADTTHALLVLGASRGVHEVVAKIGDGHTGSLSCRIRSDIERTVASPEIGAGKEVLVTSVGTVVETCAAGTEASGVSTQFRIKPVAGIGRLNGGRTGPRCWSRPYKQQNLHWQREGSRPSNIGYQSSPHYKCDLHNLQFRYSREHLWQSAPSMPLKKKKQIE